MPTRTRLEAILNDPGSNSFNKTCALRSLNALTEREIERERARSERKSTPSPFTQASPERYRPG
jgi:hypothetical protein